MFDGVDKDDRLRGTNSMPRAELVVEVPPGTWIHGVSTARPDVAFRVVTALSGGETGVVLVEVSAGDPLALAADVRRHETVRDVDLLWKREETTLLQVEVRDPLLLRPAVQARVPLRTPFVVRDGEVTWEVTTSTERLSALGERLEDLGVGYHLQSVHGLEGEADPVLTDRQRETLLTAVELGYYESPRRATLTDVAADLAVAKSTCSDTLHRAESNVVAWFVDEYLADRS